MEQSEYWQDRWRSGRGWPVNGFARRCCARFKENNLTGVLDLGCGAGVDSIYFARQGLRVTAVDFSASGIEAIERSARRDKLTNIEVVREDLTQLDFPPETFGAVYAHLSLHYFDDETTTRIFDRVRDILRPGGLFCVKCKSTDDVLYGQGEPVGPDMFVKAHLRHFFSREYMADKLARFRILHLRRTTSLYHGYKSHFIEAVAEKVG